jgi:uncharacterized protein involved in type VI secretion and phage assembly
VTTHAPASFGALALGVVTDNDDPDGRGRIKVRLSNLDLELWASVATNSAGPGYGVQLLPRREEVVVVAFISAELAVVLGSLWTGAGKPHAQQEPVQERYALVTPAGTQLVCDDQGQPKITLKTPNGNVITLTDDSGGQAQIDVQGTSVTVTSSKVEIRSSGSVEVQASTMTISASMLTVDASLSKFSGMVKCDVLKAESVISSSYTPGAGNIW